MDGRLLTPMTASTLRASAGATGFGGFAVAYGTLDPASDPRGYAQVQRRGATVVTIGKFDGIHRGHRALLAQTVREARRRGLQAGVVTFDVHPREVLGGVRHRYLTSMEERKRLFAETGLDFMLLLRATPQLFALEPGEFAARLVEALDTRAVIVGGNFRFGRKAAGDIDTFARLGIDAVAVDLYAAGTSTVSSSRIREELMAGQVECVADLLGRPYCVCGKVVEEAGARLIVEIPHSSALPSAGVYTGQVGFDEEGVVSRHPAVLVVPPSCVGTIQVQVVRQDTDMAPARGVRFTRLVFEGSRRDERPSIAFRAGSIHRQARPPLPTNTVHHGAD